MGMPTDPTWTQEDYAFYLDGSESGATLIGSAGSQQDIGVGRAYHCRLAISDTAGAYNSSNPNLTVRWQYSVNAGSNWYDITTSTPIQFIDNTSLTDGGATTDRDPTGTGAFNAGRIYESANNSAVVYTVPDDGSTSYTEVVLHFLIDPDQTSDNDEILIRCVEGDGTLFGGSYTNADLNVVGHATWVGGHYKWVEDDGYMGVATYYTEDTSHTWLVDDPFRLRISWGESNDQTENKSISPYLQFNHEGAGWVTVGAATAVKYATSAYYATDPAYDFTSRVSGPTGCPTFNGVCEFDIDNSTGTFGQAFSDSYQELEFCIEIDSAQVSNNDSITFRLVYGSDTTFDSYDTTPTLTVDTGFVDLTSSDDKSASKVTSPTFVHIHNLTSDDDKSASKLSSPTLNTVFHLTSNDLKSGPKLSSPSFTHTHNLTANEDKSASKLSSPTFTHTHALASNDLKSASKLTSPTFKYNLTANKDKSTTSVSSPTFTHTHALTANHLKSASLESGPTISTGATYNLTSNDDKSATKLSSPTFVHVHNLTSNNSKSGSNESSPSIQSIHNLNSSNLKTASKISQETLVSFFGLTSNDDKSATKLSSPSLSSIHNLVSNDLKSSTKLSSPDLGTAGISNLTSNDDKSVSKISSPTLNVVYNLNSSNLKSASKESGPSIETAISITAQHIKSASKVSSSTLQGIHNLAANDSKSSSKVSSATITHLHELTASNSKSSSKLSSPTLKSSLDANDLKSASKLSSPSISTTYNLLSSDLKSVSKLSSPSFYAGSLTAESLKSSTRISSPRLGSSKTCEERLIQAVKLTRHGYTMSQALAKVGSFEPVNDTFIQASKILARNGM